MYVLFILMLSVSAFSHAGEIPRPEGVTIEITDDNPPLFRRLKAVGESDIPIGDRKDVQRASKIATLKAKAAIAKFLGEDLKSDELVEEVSELSQQTNGHATSISRNDAEKLVETIRSSSSEFMKGILVLEQVVDPTEKRVIVTVGTNQASQRTADLVKQAFKSDSGYRPLISRDEEQVQAESAHQEIRRSPMYDEFF